MTAISVENQRQTAEISERSFAVMFASSSMSLNPNCSVLCSVNGCGTVKITTLFVVQLWSRIGK